MRFKIHSCVLSDKKADFVFCSEYSALICKVLTMKIQEIASIEVEELPEQIKKAVNKSLEWKAQKNIIGTLFALMCQTGAIKGTKADVMRGLKAMFPNLSEDTLKENFKLRFKEDENKYTYSTDTKNALSNFIEFLKDSTPN